MEKQCPLCGEIQSYKTRVAYLRAVKLNKRCFKCACKHRKEETARRKLMEPTQEYKRNCPECNKELSYRNIVTFHKATSKNSSCASCTNRRSMQSRINGGTAPKRIEATFKSTPFLDVLKKKSDGGELDEKETILVWEAFGDLARRKFVQQVFNKGFKLGEVVSEDWITDCQHYLFTYALEKFCIEKTKRMSHPVNFFALCINRFYTQKITSLVKNPESSIEDLKPGCHGEGDHDDWDITLHIHPDYHNSANPTVDEGEEKLLDKYRTLWEDFYSWTQSGRCTAKQASLFVELDSKLKNAEAIPFKGKEIWMSVFKESNVVHGIGKAYATSTILNTLIRWLKDTRRLPDAASLSWNYQGDIITKKKRRQALYRAIREIVRGMDT